MTENNQNTNILVAYQVSSASIYFYNHIYISKILFIFINCLLINVCTYLHKTKKKCLDIN